MLSHNTQGTPSDFVPYVGQYVNSGIAEDLDVPNEKLKMDDVRFYSSLIDEFNGLLLLSNSDVDEKESRRNIASKPVPSIRQNSTSSTLEVASPLLDDFAIDPPIMQLTPKISQSKPLWITRVDMATSPLRPTTATTSRPRAHFSEQGSSKYSRLRGVSFDIRTVPLIPPPVTEETPDEWYSKHEMKLERVANSMEADRLRRLQIRKVHAKDGMGVGHIAYQLTKLGSKTTAIIDNKIVKIFENRERNMRKANIKQAKARLAKYWPSVDKSSFVVEFDCFALHDRRPIRGHVLLTNSSLLFLGKGKNELVIVEEIPLSDIVSYSKGVSVPCNVEKGARCVMGASDPLAIPDTVQIFTSEGIQFDFMNFSQKILKASASRLTGTYVHDGHTAVVAYSRFVNYLDHVWRPNMPASPDVSAPLDNAVTFPVDLL